MSSSSVFISYARKDATQINGLVDLLRDRGFAILRDVDDILPAEQWRSRLRQMIEEADAVAFFISPASVASAECADEIRIAEELKKKIVPVLIAETAGLPPGDIAKLNYIHLHLIADAGAAAEIVAKALSTDIAWLREHARIGVRARRWTNRGSPTSELLRGHELVDAVAWLADQKAAHEEIGVTPEHRAYIAASEQHAAFERQFTKDSYVRKEVMYLIAGLATVWMLFKLVRMFLET